MRYHWIVNKKDSIDVIFWKLHFYTFEMLNFLLKNVYGVSSSQV